MTWTYVPAQLSISPLFQVRFLIGDTISTDPQIEDEEINFALALSPGIYRASAQCCRSLSSKLSRKADTVTGELHTAYSQLAKNYAARAVEYDNKANISGGGLPYAGGISVSDKQTVQENSDRVQPSFNIGMMDDTLPEGKVGNETTDTGV